MNTCYYRHCWYLDALVIKWYAGFVVFAFLSEFFSFYQTNIVSFLQGSTFTYTFPSSEVF
jgi:hypothetical protein